MTSLLCDVDNALNEWMAWLKNMGVSESSPGLNMIGIIPFPDTFVPSTGVDPQNPSSRPMCSTSWISGGEGGGGERGGGGNEGGKAHGLFSSKVPSDLSKCQWDVR